MYRLVASDMDDTFLDRAHQLIPANIEAVRRMRAAGIMFVPCSGRPYPSILSSLEGPYFDAFEGGYIVSYNGACINRVGDPEPLTGTWLDRGVAEELWGRGRELGICTHAYAADGSWFVANLEEDERDWLKGFPYVIDLGRAPADLSFIGEQPVAKILYADEDFEYILRLGEESASELDPAKVQHTYSSRRYVEFVPAGVDKGAGLEALAALLGIDMSETVGVGDAANDLAMIRAAGLGVGVANVTPDVAPYCDVILKTSAYDGAFPELLDEHLLV